LSATVATVDEIAPKLPKDDEVDAAEAVADAPKSLLSAQFGDRQAQECDILRQDCRGGARKAVGGRDCGVPRALIYRTRVRV